MPKLFDTLHVKLKGPLCECRATRQPDKGAYSIYFPVDKTGLAAVKVECNLCNMSLIIPWQDLTGSVVYSKPKTKPKASAPRTAKPGRGGGVTIRGGEAGSPGVKVGVVRHGDAWRQAGVDWKEAERRFEEMTRQASAQLETQNAAIQGLTRLWETTPDMGTLFGQTLSKISVETPEQKPEGPGSPHESEAAPSPEPPPPEREPETAAPEPEAPADTRPA